LKKPGTGSVLEAEGLSVTYSRDGGRLRVLRGLDLAVRAGEIVLVIGPEGSGKTVLLSILGCLITPTRGTVRILDKEVTRLPRWQRSRFRAKHIGFMFKRTLLLPNRSVLANVMLPLRNTPRSTWREGEKRARELLTRLGLGDKMYARPERLTPAEQQLVALARALVNRPSIVLADDSMSELDGASRRRLLGFMREIGREEGVSFILTTSDPSIAPETDRSIQLPEPEYVSGSTRGVTLTERARRRSTHRVLSELYEAEFGSLSNRLAPFINLIVRPLFFTLIVSVAITYLCFLGMALAERGRMGLSSHAGRLAVDSVGKTIEYLSDVIRGDLGVYRAPRTRYYWAGDINPTPVIEILRRTVPKSAALLFLALILGAVVGVPLGLGAALARHRRGSLGFVILAIIGISVPSFFLALLLQILEITWYKKTGIRLVPLGGFGWDSHLVLPVIVLAARPIAQIARVSFVSLAEVLDADHIRTARAKGLSNRAVLWDHAVPTAAIPILTSIGTSLRFALSSLPVVELVFDWPGMGKTLLEAIRQYEVHTATALVLCLGIAFTLTNSVLDYLYRVVDPRLRSESVQLSIRRSWTASLEAVWLGLCDWVRRIGELLFLADKGESDTLPSLMVDEDTAEEFSAESEQRSRLIRAERRRIWLQATVGNPPLVLGAIIGAILLAIVVLGPHWAPHDPFNTITTLTIDGQFMTPPFPPSARFPLGTDQQGRDILSLILVGARRTLSLALLGVLARLVIALLLGCISGWFAGSLLDRLILSLAETLAAFPALLLAMIVIYALGIQQGLWVFVVALCVIGWGEATQYVRGQVMAIREKAYVEGAFAVGAGDGQILLRHVLPNLLPALMVLACLEMSGVLMILGELGFIGVFIGGGFRSGHAFYFDVPEWGVMLSNTWRRFRTYPWATLYPALAFTIAIVGFNLFGEGLRRLTERLTLNLNRLFNRYTFAALVGIFALIFFTMEGTGPWRQYLPVAEEFNTQRAMADIEYLAGPELKGRKTGTPELDLAADYIARQFEVAGLQPAGEEINGKYTYFQVIPHDYRDFTAPPSLSLRPRSGAPLGDLKYRRDYLEYPYSYPDEDMVSGEVIYVGLPSRAVEWPESGMSFEDMEDKVLLVTSIREVMRNLRPRGFLIVVNDEYISRGKYELPLKHAGGLRLWAAPGQTIHRPAVMWISRSLANRILAPQGYTIEQLLERESRLASGEGIFISTGFTAEISIPTLLRKRVESKNVLGFIPGADTELDGEAILVVAYYDGLGIDPFGVMYPGANDNASGVATMLEIARMWRERDFRPKRTVIFVAWAGGERHERADIDRFMRARKGFIGAYRIAAVVKLSGVGAGAGDAILLRNSTSGRLTELFQEAGRRVKVPITTKGRGLHDRFGVDRDLDRKIPQIELTWDGSDVTAHTPEDATENISPDKLEKAGRTAALALMVLAREKQY